MTVAAPPSAIAVAAVRRGDETVVSELAGTEPWRPRLLRRDGCVARVALVQSRASVLGGDDAVLELDVGAGGALELLELGATVVHDARGGPPARLDVIVRLGAGARLVWLAQPLIAASGCGLRRSTAVELEAGAAVLLRETLVLGRAGEEPGRVRAHTRITLEGRPVVDETLDTGPLWRLRSPVVAGGSAMIDTLTLAGLRDPQAPPAAFQAHEPATLWRALGPAQAGPDDDGAAIARRWRGVVLG